VRLPASPYGSPLSVLRADRLARWIFPPRPAGESSGFPPLSPHPFPPRAVRFGSFPVRTPMIAFAPLRRAWLLCLLPLLTLGLRGAPEADPLGPGEKAAGEWIQVRLETARLESQWISEKPFLESMVGSLKERAQALEEQRDLLTAKTAKDREDIASLQAKNRAAAEDLHAAETRLAALAAKLTDLRPFLPPRLSEALELSYRSIGNPALGVGERMQLTMTMVNRCLEFNRAVTAGEEVLTIDDGDGAKSLEVIYWGLGHGYALDRGAGKAWYGAPGPKGWQWEARPDAVKAVTRLIAIYNDKADPDFVAVPAAVTTAQGGDK